VTEAPAVAADDEAEVELEVELVGVLLAVDVTKRVVVSGGCDVVLVGGCVVLDGVVEVVDEDDVVEEEDVVVVDVVELMIDVEEVVGILVVSEEESEVETVGVGLLLAMELDDVGSEELVGDVVGAAWVDVDIMEAVLVELEAIVDCLCPSLTGCLKPGSTYAAATQLCGRGREDEALLFRVWERASDVLLAACRLSQGACQSGSDRMGSRRENGTNNDQRRLQSNASSVGNRGASKSDGQKV
jgi:hypothetical protein